MKAYLLFILLLSTSSLSAIDSVDQAEALYLHGRFRQAVVLLSNLSQSSPEDGEVRLWFGKALLKTRKWDDAVRQMEKAVQLEPNNAVYYLWLGRACGGRASHSSFITASGWARRVLSAFEAAQSLAPDNMDVRFDLMTYYLEAPGFLGGGREKAEAEATAIAELSPSAGYTARAVIFKKDKKWDRARDELAEAASLFPHNVASFVELADFLLDRRDFTGAETKACRAVSLCADLPRAKLISAAAQIRLGKNLVEAENILQSMCQGSLRDDDPAFEEVFYWLGQAFLAQEKNLQAREAFSAALRFNPDYDKAKSALSQLR